MGQTRDPFLLRSVLLVACLVAAGACDGACGCGGQSSTDEPTTGPIEEEEPRLERLLLGEDELGDPWLVLLHGYGANGADLVALARYLRTGSGYRVAIPEAPLSLARNRRAWFPLDVNRVRAARQRGELAFPEEPEELEDARAAVIALVEELRMREPSDPPDVVLAGFSQGAMMAMETALHLEPPPAAVAMLSGGWLVKRDWLEAMSEHPELPVFISHGNQDPLIPQEDALEIRSALAEAEGRRVVFLPFAGGHTIPRSARSQLLTFLKSLESSPERVVDPRPRSAPSPEGSDRAATTE